MWEVPCADREVGLRLPSPTFHSETPSGPGPAPEEEGEGCRQGQDSVIALINLEVEAELTALSDAEDSLARRLSRQA